MIARDPEVETRVQLRLNRRRLWRWHLWLRDALADRLRTPPEIVLTDGPPLGSGLSMLLSLERLLYGMPGEHACDVIDPAALSAGTSSQDRNAAAVPPLVIDLSGPGPETSAPTLRIAYDGSTDEDVLFAALLDERPPALSLTDARAPARAWTAYPAIEDRKVLTRALDNAFSSLVRLCLKAVAEFELNQGPGVPAGQAAQGSVPMWRPMSFAAHTVAARVQSKLLKLCGRAPRWFVGWRWATDTRMQVTHRLAQSGYVRLADDGRRYYADPFVIAANGSHYLFCEEFDYALGRGLISVTVVPRTGTPQRPRVVLDRPYHLSYPFVFEHAGQIWMMPESSGARTVELYRADPFPDRWVLETTLLRDIDIGDATIVQQDGRWWMFGGTRAWMSSSWDALSLFHAPELTGPWTPHPRNPVLIDLRSARPAGALFRQNGGWWRPAQDCSRGYGSGLALCSVDRLDPEDYAQSVKAVVTPGPAWPGRGLHTLNWSDGLEVIDGIG